jgi:hypothetical protein
VGGTQVENVNSVWAWAPEAKAAADRAAMDNPVMRRMVLILPVIVCSV